MRILVYGSRDWTDRQVIHRDLDAVVADLPPGEVLEVIHGFAAGADRIADEWASAHPRAVPHRYVARWDMCVFGHRTDPCPSAFHRKVNRAGADYCPLAGFRRNQKMLDHGQPHRAFGYDLGTPGTADMSARCRAAGLAPVIRTGRTS